MPRTCHHLLCLLFIIFCISPAVYPQKKHDPAKKARKYHRRNRSYSVTYEGHSGRSGRNAFDLFKFLSWDGSDGRPGGQGPCLQVKVTGVPSGDSIILAIDITEDVPPQADHFTDHYYVNPRHGKITIFANGGSGGMGGNGSNVRPSSGYSGGNGGLGGIIDMVYDSTALAYIDCPCIVALNHGGEGGRGGSGGRKDGNEEAEGAQGLPGGPGPPVCKKDMNGNILRLLPELKY